MKLPLAQRLANPTGLTLTGAIEEIHALHTSGEDKKYVGDCYEIFANKTSAVLPGLARVKGEHGEMFTELREAYAQK